MATSAMEAPTEWRRLTLIFSIGYDTDIRTGRQPTRRSLNAVNQPMALYRPGEDYLRSTSPRRCTEQARNPVSKLVPVIPFARRASPSSTE
jgi:hypothetical protein